MAHKIEVKSLIKCGLRACENYTDRNGLLYHQPGDIDSDNMAPLIVLCDDDAKNYPENYPDPIKL